MESRLFEAILQAEIGNGKIYAPSYNASSQMYFRGDGWSKNEGDNWEPLNAAKISPGAKSTIRGVVNQLDPKEIKALDDFDPNPADIQIDMNNEKAQINFPDGHKKVVSA